MIKDIIKRIFLKCLTKEESCSEFEKLKCNQQHFSNGQSNPPPLWIIAMDLKDFFIHSSKYLLFGKKTLI